MAGVYVPGVKKPYGCDFCPWYRTFWSFCTAANKNISVLEMNKGPDWCPLVEVPDHGDLIDRSLLEEDGEWDEREDGYIGYSRAHIQGAPVVIPAERSEE